MTPRPGEPCSCGCGKPAVASGLASACYSRWTRAGRPETGPPPPKTGAARIAAYRAAQERTAAEDAAHDTAWFAGEPERRAHKAKPLAADLVRCVARDDAEGVRMLLHRVTDWAALAVVLAECASPVRTSEVTGIPLVKPAAARRSAA